MAIDATFMAALMKIPYFARLSEQNGQEWLGDLFQTLEVESFDFSQFESIAADSDIEQRKSHSIADSSAIDLGIADVTIDAAAPSDDDNGDSQASEKRSSDEIEQAQIAMGAKHSEASAKSSAADSGDGGSQRRFANDVQENVAYSGPTDWERQLKYEALRSHPDYGTFKLGEEPGSVALNGVYDELKLSAGNDKIYTVEGARDSGTTKVNAGDGTDTLFLTAGGLKADLAGQSDFGSFGGKVEFRGVENVIGSSGNDTIIGNAGDNKLVGRGGNDRIDGGGGDDEIIGGSGKNVLNGGGGNDDIMGGNAVDIINGGSGDDVINGGGGDDDLSGGDGSDEIEGGTGDDKIDGGNGADDIDGGDGDDEIDGGGGDDTIDAGDGNDIVDGGGGDDEIDGGDGDDTIDGGAGADTLNGDLGNDTINGGDDDDEIDGGDGDDTLNGDDGNDDIDGGIGNDTIDGGDGDDDIDGGEGNDDIDGGIGNDTIVGLAGTDTINGGEGNDDIDGGADSDVITGGAGNDVLKGDAGDDTITGGAGADTITGGDGSDVYVYTDIADSGVVADTFDLITDFDVANDKFDLTALLASDEFDFIAANGGAFTGGSDNPEVRWTKSGGSTIIEIDIDGNGVADMQINLDDEVDLTAANFNL